MENPRDGGAWWAAVYGVTQSRTRLKQLSSSSSSSILLSVHLPWEVVSSQWRGGVCLVRGRLPWQGALVEGTDVPRRVAAECSALKVPVLVSCAGF